MEFIDKLKKFIKFINKKYEDDGVFRSYGEGPWQLIDESGIDFGDAKEQLSAMDVLLKQGLIEIVNFKKYKHVTNFTKIRPTMAGLKNNQQDWLKIFKVLTSAVAEGVTKGLTNKF
jgi:hypothetical protein